MNKDDLNQLFEDEMKRIDTRDSLITNKVKDPNVQMSKGETHMAGIATFTTLDNLEVNNYDIKELSQIVIYVWDEIEKSIIEATL